MKRLCILLTGVMIMMGNPMTTWAKACSHTDVLAQDNNAFAIDLYDNIKQTQGNIFFSPYSISTALAMTYAGARQNTALEMAKTLHFSLAAEHLHPAFAQLDSAINTREKDEGVRLLVANALFPQKKYAFKPEYLDIVQTYYKTSVQIVDYRTALEAARHQINAWVEEKTQDKIKELIRPGILNTLTRLVLVNAIYFKANWLVPFKEHDTQPAPFYLLSGDTVEIPMMNRTGHYGYANQSNLQILEIPYQGDEISMVILLPEKKDGLAKIENQLTNENLKKWTEALEIQEISVFLPKFKIESDFRLDETLMNMGMKDAFDENRANFSGMDGNVNWLYIGGVIHKAFVEVNEQGTEAAAATAVIMVGRGMPRPVATFRADHPFLFFIREKSTGSILFIGKMIG